MIKLNTNEIQALKKQLKKYPKKSAIQLKSLIEKYPELLNNIGDYSTDYEVYRKYEFYAKLHESMMTAAHATKTSDDLLKITDQIRRLYISQLMTAIQAKKIETKKDEIISGYWLMSDEHTDIQTYIDLQSEFIQLIKSHLNDNKIGSGMCLNDNIRAFTIENYQGFLNYCIDNNNDLVFSSLTFTADETVILNCFSNVSTNLKTILNKQDINIKAMKSLIVDGVTPESLYRFLLL